LGKNIWEKYLSGKMHFGKTNFWDNSNSGKLFIGKNAFWEKVFGKSAVGKVFSGKVRSGKTRGAKILTLASKQSLEIASLQHSHPCFV